jgi:c-di-GMP-binding flagellar brake protein YcgR
MTSLGDERRKHVRIFLPGGQVRLASGMLMALVGKVVDLSIGGVKFACNVGLNIGDEIDLELTLPTGLKFRCGARIVHAENLGGKENNVVYGTQFNGLGPREQQELGDYIMKKRAEQDDMLHHELE